MESFASSSVLHRDIAARVPPFAHATFNSYGDYMLAIATSKGDGSTGQCGPIGQPRDSGETTYPPDACSTANARAVDGEANIAISNVDKAKAYSVAERGSRNIAVTRAVNGGDIIWNTTPSLPTQPPNPHAGMTPDCPWPLPPLPHDDLFFQTRTEGLPSCSASPVSDPG